VIVRLSNLGAEAQQDDRRQMFKDGLDTLGWMEEVLSEVANDDQDRLARLQSLTEEATDLIHLLQLENSDTSAVDAVTILLQLKRSTHAVLAA